MKVTNIEKGARGINAVGGPVLIEPGETVDVEVSDTELAVAETTGWFSFEGAAGDDDQGVSRDDLKKQADELGIEYPKNISTAKLKELVDAKLAE